MVESSGGRAFDNLIGIPTEVFHESGETPFDNGILPYQQLVLLAVLNHAVLSGITVESQHPLSEDIVQVACDKCRKGGFAGSPFLCGESHINRVLHL